MNFGKWIFVAFVLFALFIGTLVTICVRQDISLVTKEYYKEELVYQDQIVRVENANQLNERPEISINADHLSVRYDRFPEIEKGSIRLMRPSDEMLDKHFEIGPSSGTEQVFDLENAVPGMYRARFTWEQGGKEYFVEKIVVL